jgi:hypothetical protein
MEHKTMKKTVSVILLSAVAALISCKKSVDISGRYIKAKGDYRYDVIIFEKAGGDKYNITGYNAKVKKFSTIGELKDKKIDIGWMSQLTFKDEFNQFYLHSGKGSVYVKDNSGKK